eukprot:3936120-Rhodomonas_salina.1
MTRYWGSTVWLAVLRAYRSVRKAEFISRKTNRAAPRVAKPPGSLRRYAQPAARSLASSLQMPLHHSTFCSRPDFLIVLFDVDVFVKLCCSCSTARYKHWARARQ